MKFEYVATGLSYFQILNQIVIETPEISKIVNDHLDRINGIHNHNLSLLYNAYHEHKFGPKLQKLGYPDTVHHIHADSGGLQIITLGKEITPELKEEIYRRQARYSDVAMCFDEIPIRVIGERSRIGDLDTRVFDFDRIEGCARATGRNIRRQLEIFEEEKSTAKPMLIVQGNCYDSYMKWTECVVDEIPKELHGKIAGLAIAGSSLGTGFLEDIEKMAYVPFLPFETKNVHILGVGSLKRLLPLVAFIKGGHFSDDYHFSYDSTSHTMGIANGRYFLGDTTVNFSRHRNQTYLNIYNDLDGKYKLNENGVSFDKFFEIVNTHGGYYTFDKQYDYKRAADYFNVKAGFICSSIENFQKSVSDCYESEKHLKKIAERYRVLIEIIALLNIKSLEQFQNWKNEYGKYIYSRRITNSEPSTLEAFL